MEDKVDAASFQGDMLRPSEVRWQCVRCTKSCGDTATHKRRILLLEDDVRRIEQKTRKTRDEFAVRSRLEFPYEFEMRKTDRGKCVFLKEGLCSIYAARPLICKFYPFSLKRDETGKLAFELDSECTGVAKSSPMVMESHYRALLETARAAFGRNALLTHTTANES